MKRASPGRRVWEAFSAKPSTVAALAGLATLLLIAAFAPFLAQDKPITMVESGQRVWPLIRALGALDILWLGAVFAVFGGWGVARWAGKRGRSRARWGGLGAMCVLGAAVLTACLHAPHHERRRYGEELILRARVAAWDAGRADASSLEKILETSTESLQVSLEIEARLAALGNPGLLRKLTRQNREHMEALEGAVWPLLPQAPDRPSFAGVLRPGESPRHPLGTDALGRDLLAVLIHGARRALTVTLLALGLSGLFGLVLGALAGWCGGAVDWTVQRLFELTLCLPVLFMLVALTAWIPPDWRQGALPVGLFLGLLLWTEPGRLMRSEVGRLKNEDQVLAARALGLPTRHVLARHVLPDAVTPLLVSLSLAAATVLLVDAALSFLGLGESTVPGWGRILYEARSSADLGEAWHLAIFPGAAVCLTAFAFNLVGEGLREALRPATRRTR